MSRRNPSSRSVSSPNVGEKTLLFFSWCWMPRKGLYRSSRHLKPISFAKNLHQVLKPKEMALGRSPILLNAASNITHSTIAPQDSSRVPTTFNAHCTVHYTVEDFNVNFANHDAKSVRYCPVLCAWYHMQERNVPGHGIATGAGVLSKVVWEYNELWLQEVVLLEKTIELHKPEWHFSLRSILSVPALGAFLDNRTLPLM